LGGGRILPREAWVVFPCLDIGDDLRNKISGGGILNSNTVDEIRELVRVIPWLYEQCAVGAGSGDGHVVLVHSSAKRQARSGPGDHVIEARRKIEEILSSWTAMVVEELGVAAPQVGVRSHSGFLNAHAGWLAGHSSADDLMRELDDLAGAAVPVIDRRGRGPIELGQCVEDGCFAPLVADVENSATLVRCEVGHRWSARDWLRIMYRDQSVAPDQDRRLVPTKSAAQALGVSEATIRQWVHRGKLTRHGTRGNAAYDLAELAELAHRLPARPGRRPITGWY